MSLKMVPFIQKRLLLPLFFLILVCQSVFAQPGCSISITNITETRVTPVSLELSSVVINGNVEDCDSVVVIIRCTKNAIAEKTVPVTSGINWSANFNYADLKPVCACNQTLSAYAYCKDNKTCHDSKTKILCSDCPSIDLSVDSGVCLESGGVRYNYAIDLSSPLNPLGTMNLDFDSDVPPYRIAIPITTSTHYTGTFDVECENYGEFRNFKVDALGCYSNPYLLMYSEPVKRKVNTCTCPFFGEIEVTDISDCKKRFSISVNDCISDESTIVWNFGDGHVNDENLTEVENNFPSGTGPFLVKVFIAGQETTCNKTKTVNINCQKGGDDDDNIHPPKQDGDDCGFLGLGCISFNLCWLLAILLGLLIIARLILVAGGWGTTLDIGSIFSATITAADIAHALVGAFALIVFSLCPCEAAAITILACIIAIIIIAIIAFYSSGSLPNWFMAIVIGIALIIASIIVFNLKDC